MSGSIARPDWDAAIKDLARRVGNLERRTTARAAPPDTGHGNAHDGTGDASVVLEPTTSTSVASGNYTVTAGADATASGVGAIAAGHGAGATGDSSVTIGDGALTTVDDGVAIGRGAVAAGSAGETAGIAIGATAAANADLAVAIGDGAASAHDGAVVLGDGVLSNGTDQLNIGQKRIVAGLAGGALTGAAMANSTFTVDVDQTGNLLKFTVRYSTGTVKTGTVALV